MRKEKIRLISLILALSVTSSIFVGAVPLNNKVINKDNIKQLLLGQLQERGKKLEGSNKSAVLNKYLKQQTSEKYEEENKNSSSGLIRVIVQLEDSPAIKSGEEEQQVKKGQASAKEAVENITGGKIRKSFGYLVNGFSLDVKRGDIEKIKAIEGVKSVTLARVYYPDMNFAKEITKTYDVWKDYGYKGEGLVVSVIDTGIDYTHKDLQAINKEKIKIDAQEAKGKVEQLSYGKYFTDKIPFGHNYADGNEDIIDKGEQHGMHVAGIVAANGSEDEVSSFKAIKGVAPEAQLLAMKVFSNNVELQGAFDDDIIAAIEDSVKLGADVINMSLGSEAGFMDDEDPQQVAVKNAADNGVLCVVSAGNAQTSATNDGWSQPENLLGLKDTGVVGSPSVSEDALSVASMENSKLTADNLKYITGSSDEKEIAELMNNGDNKVKFQLAEADSGDNPDAKDMSQYTSWGPTSNLELKPEITAPGGDIYSLANNNEYQNMSGTSMSAPHTSGAEAIIIQSVKERNLNISGRELIDFIKKTAMNTAEVMQDKYNTSIPYSPRRQGAGLLQIDKAVKNEVLLTGESGKAEVSLKEIQNSTSFKLILKNFGDKEIAYNLDKSPILSETTDSNGFIKPYVISGATITLNNNKVIVPANGEASITVNLNIPDNFEKDNFVEGYVKFISQDKSEPNLSIPYMGFYGDWSNESIIDKPIYDNENSLLKQTAIGTSILGMTIPLSNKAETTAISPNDDGLFDNSLPIAYLLRNIKNLQVEILDEDKNVIRVIDREENLVKNTLEEYLNWTRVNTELYNALWDGTIYNESTGDYELVKDGQYYYRLKSKVDISSAKEQILDMPVKVDTAAPNINILGIFKEDSADGNSKYLLKWKAKDDLSGLFEGVGIVFVNGQQLDLTPSILEKEDIYSVEVDNIIENGINEVSISILDNAANIATAQGTYKVGTIDTVSFTNLKKGDVKGITDVNDGKINFFGAASDNVSKLTINNKEVHIVDGYFSYTYEVRNGKNTLEVVGLNKNDKEIFKQNYEFIVDLDAPELIINEPSLSQDEINYINSDEVVFNGRVKDENLSELYSANILGLKEEPIEVNEDGSFTFKKILNSDLDMVILVAEDKAGNQDVKSYIIAKSEEVSNFSVSFLNLDTINVLSAKEAPSDIYTIMGTMTEKPEEFKINGEEVKVNDDLTFTKDIKLSQGTNRINAYASNSKGDVFEGNYKILFDSQLPKVKIDGLSIRNDGNIYVNTEIISLKGEASDNLYGYSLKINGDTICNLNRYPSNDPSILTKRFEKQLTLKQETTNVDIELVDLFGNTKKLDFKVFLDKIAPVKPVIKLSETKVTNKPVEVTLNSDEEKLEKLEYSFDGKRFFEYKDPFKVEAATKIYARATDYAGNTSEASEVDVNIDTNGPVITVNGVENGGIYTSKVNPTVISDDKEAALSMILNGKEYDGKAIDTAGDYELVVTAKDKVGNEGKTNIKFTVKQATTSTSKGNKGELVLGDVKSNYETLVLDGKEFNNAEAKINTEILTDSNKFITVKTKGGDITVPTALINDKDIKSVVISKEEVKPWENSSLGFKFLGKVYDLEIKAELKDGTEKLISKFQNNKVKLAFKLNDEEVKNLDTAKLGAFYFDEIKKEWSAIDNGAFDKGSLTYTFETTHFSKYVVGVKEEKNSKNNEQDSSGTENGETSTKAGGTTETTANGDNSANSSSETKAGKINEPSITKTGALVGSTLLTAIGFAAVAAGFVIAKRKKEE